MTPPELPDIQNYLAQSAAAAWQVPGLPANTPLRPVRRIGVIGAGTMGGGIAMNFVSAGFPVTIVETTSEALERGLSVVRKNFQRSADKGRFPQEEVDVRMNRFDGQLSVEALGDCDLIIEAVFENMDLKRRIFTDLDRVAKPGAILATNTSALDVDEIAAVTKRPQDVIGLHFFSPANVMKLLEIVRARHTADDVIATSMELARGIGKIATLVGVCYGFVGNRVHFARKKQADKLLYRGVLPWDIDNALTDFGFKMGPFQTSDLAGLDLFWTKGGKTDSPIRDALCELDRRGQKAGAGYYDYDAARRPVPSDITARVIREVAGVAPITMSAEEIVETCLFPMINESLRILEENKAQRPSDIDVVFLNGYGWPRDTGGPMYYGDMVGAPAVLARMETLAAEDPAFAPAGTLRDLVASGGRFTEIDMGGLRV